MTKPDPLAALPLTPEEIEWLRLRFRRSVTPSDMGHPQDGTLEGTIYRLIATLDAARQPPEALREALADMTSLATDGAARQHLDQSGILQDPPHGMGRFVECEAPWCVRNQQRLARARAALEATDDQPR